jgi:hypothetical protein
MLLLGALGLAIWNSWKPKPTPRIVPNYQKDDSLLNTKKTNYSILKDDEKNIDNTIHSKSYNADSVESSIRGTFEKIKQGKYPATYMANVQRRRKAKKVGKRGFTKIPDSLKTERFMRADSSRYR